MNSTPQNNEATTYYPIPFLAMTLRARAFSHRAVHFTPILHFSGRLDGETRQRSKLAANSPEYVRIRNGGVGERLKPAVLKTVRPERVSGVQIPPPPPYFRKFGTQIVLRHEIFERHVLLRAGAAVLPRTTNSGSIVIAFGYGIFAVALIRCNRVSAAITPMSRSGCRTVVRPGFWNAAL